MPALGAVVVGGGFVWVDGAHGIEKVNPATDEVVGTIPINADGVAFGEGAVWATVVRGGLGAFVRHSVVRVDPRTNEVTTVGRPGPPEQEFPNASFQGRLATGDGAVWYAIHTQLSSPGAIERIDIRTGVPRTIRLPGPADGVVVGAGAVWVRSNGLNAAVLELDPNTGKLRHQGSVVAADAIAASGSNVWITDASDNLVIKLDPNGAQSAVVENGITGPEAIAATDQAVWVATRTCDLVRIDPTLNKVVASVPVGVSNIGTVAVGSEGVWIGSGGRGAKTTSCA